MDDQVQLIIDGDDLVVIGDPAAVKGLLTIEGLWSASKDIGEQLKPVLGIGATVMQAGAEIAANSSRWVKLTKESVYQFKKYGLRKSATTGNLTGVVKGRKGGAIGAFVEFAKAPGSLLNPAALSGVGAIMAQAAMQQAIVEITAYLARIDEKVDDLLRKQNQEQLAPLIGAHDVISRTMTVRERVGRISDADWSTVQHTLETIGTASGYALLELQAIAEKLERETSVSALARTAEGAKREVQTWLAVLARCFELWDAFDVLQLDRVLEESPEELGARALAMKDFRRERLDHVSRITASLLNRMATAVGTANAEVLLNPFASPAVVNAINKVATGIVDFQLLLGIESGHRPWEARPWTDAAAKAKDKALENAGPAVAGVAAVGAVVAVTILRGRPGK